MTKRITLAVTLLCTLLLSLTMSSPTQAQTGTVELIGQIGGPSYAVFVEGNTAYIGEGPRLTILDISNPANPTVLGKSPLLPDIVQDIYVSGSYAYVAADESGLQVINISNPANPALTGSYDTPGQAYDVAVSDSYAYVAAGESGLQVINISTPANPTLTGSYGTPGLAYGVAVSGSYAYIADTNSGLQIINISNPANPTLTGSYDTPGNAFGVAVSGSYAYVADGESGLQVINISTPANPTLTGSYDHSGQALEVAVSGSLAYVASGRFGGLQIINISNPANPTLTGNYDTHGSAYGVAVSGNYAYVAAGGLQVINISNPANPTLTGSYSTLRAAYGVAVSGNYAYVADRYIGLQVINISNPANPTLTGSYSTLRYATGVAVSGDYAYVADADGERGLQVINISNPAAPTLTGSYDTPGDAYRVAVSGNYAYIANGLSGLLVFDISNPAAPTLTGSYDTPGDAYQVAVSGNYAYVADRESGLQVIDISNPATPTLTGSYDTPGVANGVAVSGSYAYLADSSGLQVINISNPVVPTLSGSYDTPGDPLEVVVNGNYAYVADSDGGLQVINISNPVVPTLSGSYNTSRAWGVAVSDNYVYVADAAEGSLMVLQFNDGSATPTVSPTPTPQPTNTPTPTPQPTHTPTAPANQPDAYETDDTCPQANAIPADGTIQEHNFHAQADVDWVSFQATKGLTYVIQARSPADSQADMVMELYGDCGTVLQPGQDPDWAADVRQVLTIPADGRYHLRLLNHDETVFGPTVRYHLSVREVRPENDPGLLILVAGRLRSDYALDLQNNIRNVSNAVYRLFQGKGYPAERIYYLATSLNLDADFDGQDDVASLSNKANLQFALTQWTQGKGLGPDRALTLYLMDHGGGDKFYLDKPRGEWVQAAELDSWLSEVEAANPGVRINIIIEACFSGSFIDINNDDPSQSITGPNRVILTSANATTSSYPSQHGAWFSDGLLTALDQGMTLAEAFQEASGMARQANRVQQPWLEANGNGIPNEKEDFDLASQRGFGYRGTFAGDQWPPYLVQAELRPAGSKTEVWAEVRDDEMVKNVWVVIYPPSYTPPVDSESMELGPTPQNLHYRQGDWYAVAATFDEPGDYHILVYAEDDNGLTARPQELTLSVGGESVYLPMVVK